MYIIDSGKKLTQHYYGTSLCGPMLPKEQTGISQVIRAYHFIYIWYFDRKSIWNCTLKTRL